MYKRHVVKILKEVIIIVCERNDMRFWSATEIVYKPCAGRHLTFIVCSRFRLVVVYCQKVNFLFIFKCS